jgi:hypothetical protein
MYVLIGIHCVPLEGKCLLTALVIVMITLNVIVRQMLLPQLHAPWTLA